jgi:hypothetical protein
MKIELNKCECDIARALARRKQSLLAKGMTWPKKAGPQSETFNNVEGFASELAFCRLFNLYPDLDAFNENPPSYDVVLHDGRTVDVKCTVYENGRLIVAASKNLTVDLFALMIGKMPAYRFAGFATGFDLMHPDRLTDYGHGAIYAMEQNELEIEYGLQNIFKR